MKLEVDSQILQQILERYALSTVTTTPLRSYNNHIYRVEATKGNHTISQRFSLRICGFAEMKPRSMLDEMAWLAFVAQRDPQLAPRPIANKNGELVTILETATGTRMSCLFDWVEGKELGGSATADHLYLMGRQVAALHNIAREFPFLDDNNDFRGDYRFDQSLMLQHLDWIEVCRGKIGATNVALLQQAVATVIQAMDRIGRRLDSYGMIHADLNIGNLLVDGDQVAIIDFEQLGRGYFLYDLAVLRSELPNKQGEAERLWQSFMAGYGEVAQPPFDHEQELDPFLIAVELTTLDWVYNTNNPVVLGEFEPQIPAILQRIQQLMASPAHGSNTQ